MAFFIAKYAFLTVSVPIYAVYQGIKWTLLKGILLLLNRYLPGFKALWSKVMVPIAQAILKSLVWIKDTLLAPIFKAIQHIGILLKNAVVIAAKTLYTHVIVPIGQFLANNVVNLAQLFKTIFVGIYNYVLVPLATGIKTVATAIFNQVLVSICRAMINTIYYSWETHFSRSYYIIQSSHCPYWSTFCESRHGNWNSDKMSFSSISSSLLQENFITISSHRF